MPNPDTNRFEQFYVRDEDNPPLGDFPQLFRPNGKPVPKHWSVFKAGEDVVIKNYTFKVAHIGESHILFEPVGPVMIGEEECE